MSTLFWAFKNASLMFAQCQTSVNFTSLWAVKMMVKVFGFSEICWLTRIPKYPLTLVVLYTQFKDPVASQENKFHFMLFLTNIYKFFTIFKVISWICNIILRNIFKINIQIWKQECREKDSDSQVCYVNVILKK